MKRIQIKLKQLGIQTFEPEQGRMTSAEIQEIERLYDVELPDIYKWALTTYGEFEIEQDYYFPTNGSRGVSLGYFLGQELLKLKDETDERLPSQMIPICDDGGNNWVCLSLRQDQTHGQIYYHHHCIGFEEDSDQGKFDTLDFLASSLSEFFDSLVVYFDPETDLPKSFWPLIEDIQGDVARARYVIGKLSKSSILNHFQAFEDARTELIDVMHRSKSSPDASEDTLDDFANAIVSMGKSHYCNIYKGRCPLPDKETWEDMTSIAHVFTEVYEHKYGLNIYMDLRH